MRDQRSTPLLTTIIFGALFFLIPQFAVGAEYLATITVEAGDHTRIDTAVSIWLDQIPVRGDGPLRLEEIKGSKRLSVPSQIEQGERRRLWWILSGTTEPGDKRRYELLAGEPVAAPKVEIEHTETALDVTVGDNKVLRYNHAIFPPPKDVNQLYARSGFIHPLWSPSGQVLTQIHPPDHLHHMGLWMPWTKTEFEGRKVDFWNLGEGEGTVRFVKFASATSGPVFGGFRAIQEHVDFTAPGGEKVALNEEWDVRVWNVVGGDEGYRVVDFTTTQRCASSSALKLLSYRYGGFCFRGIEEWNRENSEYLTSEGKGRKDGHTTRAKWCNVYGTGEKGPAGIVFMSHPDNHEHPEPMRIWSSGQVFFNFCPIQKADWTLEPGNDYVLKYRLFVYDGTITAKEAERLWQDFANRPKIRVERK